MFERLSAEASNLTVQIFWLCIVVQGSLLGYDEIALHRKREMPKWERWGHPIDSFFFLLPFFLGGVLATALPVWVFIGLAILSSLIIMKDEWVHVGRVTALESFLHAGLFVLHPVTLYWGYQSWREGHLITLLMISFLMFSTMLLQIVFWNLLDPRLQRKG